jgi:hypothetical protein
MVLVRRTVRTDAQAARVSTTDGAKVGATTDADIAWQIAGNPDTAPDMTDANITRPSC